MRFQGIARWVVVRESRKRMVVGTANSLTMDSEGKIDGTYWRGEFPVPAPVHDPSISNTQA